VDVAAARAVLGVDADATPDEVRAAYRARLRAAHPDLRGVDAGTAEVVTAYRVLRDSELVPEPEAAVAHVEDTVGVVVDGDTVVADLPAGDLFALLMEAGDRIGEVSYVDAHAGLLEVVVDVAGYGACSVVLTLQGRAGGDGTTEAWCTAEALSGRPAPPTGVITELLAEGLRSVAGP
jgi:hypothetical protein